MTGAGRADRRRNSWRTAGLICLIVSLAALSIRFLADPAHRDLGRGLLVLSVLLVAVRLLWAVRLGLEAQRTRPLRAECSSPGRPAVVPAELHRIISEVQRARKSREQYARGLGPRLEGIALRRGATAVSPEAGASRGMSAEEIGAAISRIEEP